MVLYNNKKLIETRESHFAGLTHSKENGSELLCLLNNFTIP